jgi:hypothetical protein
MMNTSGVKRLEITLIVSISINHSLLFVLWLIWSCLKQQKQEKMQLEQEKQRLHELELKQREATNSVTKYDEPKESLDANDCVTNKTRTTEHNPQIEPQQLDANDDDDNNNK